MIFGIFFFLISSASESDDNTQTVSIEFTLKNKEKVRADVVNGNFKVIDKKIEHNYDEDETALQQKEAEIELLEIEDKETFAQFKALWSKEESSNEKVDDIDDNKFAQFFNAADYLGICGEALQCFAENMVKRGLLGKNSNNIISTCFYGDGVGGWDIPWKMLIAFAAEMKIKARVRNEEVIFYSAEDRMAENSGKAASEIEEMLYLKEASLRCRIPVNTSDGAPDHEKVFGWLLCHSGILSLYVGTGLKLKLRKNAEAESFVSEFSSITMKHGDVQVAIKGIDLSEYLLEPEEIWKLMEHYPNLKGLSIQTGRIPDRYAKNFLKYKSLEALKISRYYQNNTFIKKLLVNLPKTIRYLNIKTKVLHKDVAKNFSRLEMLEELTIVGDEQGSSFIGELLINLPRTVRFLCIEAGLLPRDAAKNFSKCEGLKMLKILGMLHDNNSFIEELSINLPKTVRFLEIKAGTLSENAAKNFSKCEGLEVLKILSGEGEFLPNSLFIEHFLMDPPKTFRCLDIQVAYPLSDNAEKTILAAQRRGIRVWVRIHAPS